MNYLQQLSTNWFLIYLITLGSILLLTAFFWLRRPQPLHQYLMQHARQGEKPRIMLLLLRYLAIFSLLSLVLSFFPFSGIKLGFSIWSLFMLYILASMLLKWQHIAGLIDDKPALLHVYIRKACLMMLSIGMVLYMLAYFVR
jgi:hypothetical protein